MSYIFIPYLETETQNYRRSYLGTHKKKRSLKQVSYFSQGYWSINRCLPNTWNLLHNNIDIFRRTCSIVIVPVNKGSFVRPGNPFFVRLHNLWTQAHNVNIRAYPIWIAWAYFLYFVYLVFFFTLTIDSAAFDPVAFGFWTNWTLVLTLGRFSSPAISFPRVWDI